MNEHLAVLDGNLYVLAAGYVAAASAVCFGMFAWDKHNAIKGYWRIPEDHLLVLALLGGSLGAVTAQRWLRHKTRKEPFRTRLLSIVAFQIVAVAAVGVPPVREVLVELIGSVTR